MSHADGPPTGPHPPQKSGVVRSGGFWDPGDRTHRLRSRVIMIDVGGGLLLPFNPAEAEEHGYRLFQPLNGPMSQMAQSLFLMPTNGRWVLIQHMPWREDGCLLNDLDALVWCVKHLGELGNWPKACRDLAERLSVAKLSCSTESERPTVQAAGIQPGGPTADQTADTIPADVSAPPSGLSPIAKAVWDLLSNLLDEDARTAKQIVAALKKPQCDGGCGITISESTLRKHHLGELKPYGLKNRRGTGRGTGYYLDRDANRRRPGP